MILIMPTLYHFPLCPFSRSVRIFLAEKSIEFELVVENFWEKKSKILSLDPIGGMPIFVESNHVLSRCAPICEYIEESELASDNSAILYGDKNDLKNRAEIRKIICWINESFYHDSVRHILYEKVVKLCDGGQSPNSQLLHQAKANLKFNFSHISNLLEKRHWLAGERFTNADIVCAAHISVLDYLNEISWEKPELEQIKSWYQLIKSRPSFRSILNDRIKELPSSLQYTALDF